ncbi:MAG TPA: PAS domain S-box protein [Terracidiphilus sp.]
MGLQMQEQAWPKSQIGEDRIREAFEFAASGMAITDLDGRFQETNPAYREIVGRGPKDLEEESILSITHAEDRENCRNHLNRLLSGQTPSFVLEKRYVRPDGISVWVRNSFSLLKDEHGRPSHIILICNDITERRRAEQMLMERETLAVVGQLATSIAHEINNPLEAVLNLLYLIRGSQNLHQAHVYAAQAEEEIQRATQIASNTLQFHKQQTKPTPVNVVKLVESVLVLFKAKLAAARVTVEFEKKDNTELICFAGEIRQVLANLIRNALEAMPSGGRLRIRVRQSTDWRADEAGVRITLADTGLGMSLETRRRIYDPFFTTKGTQGTGLGLWVTASILAKHRGSMHLRSKTIRGESGTVFTLIFPMIGAQTKFPDSKKDG